MRWMVSISTRSPAIKTSGRGGYLLVFFQGERFFKRPYRDKVRFTEERDTPNPSDFKTSYTTSEHLLVSILVLMIRAIVSRSKEFGELLGLELLVSMILGKLDEAFCLH